MICSLQSTFKFPIIATCLAIFSFAPLHAHAGLFDDDEARKAIIELRGKVEAMQLEITTRIDKKADKSGTLDLLNQNEQLQQDIAKLRGDIEVLTNELSNTQRRQKDFYVDLDERLRKFETAAKAAADEKEANRELAQQKQQEEQKSYDDALTFFKNGDYKNASTAFLDFVQRYPQSSNVAPAQYWLGNAYYAQREYKNAIAAQLLVVKNYPNNPKAADALLNVASCYTELKDKNSAKKSLETLVAQYPGTNAAQIAKQRLASLK